MRSMLITLLCAAPALAQDEALAKRYHEAYVLEVIDGQPAEAARDYLELLQEKKLPHRLRLQTEFRFAVTCVLLGRADEARARLAALAKQEGLPADLRAQIDEYRKAIADVKLGTALETTLQALMLKLAKYEGAVGARKLEDIYLAFEVLGPRTVPFLRRLLRHRMRSLRWHAFQILARMDVPDLLDLWDPEDNDPGSALSSYVRGHPKRVARLEQILRGLKGGVLSTQLRNLAGGDPLSLPFILWAATQPWCEVSAVAMLAKVKGRVNTEPIVLGWMRGGRPELQRAAARFYGSWTTAKGTKKPADLFVKFCLLQDPERPASGLKEYAAAVPPSVRLQALSAILDAVQADPDRAKELLNGGIANQIAVTIDPDVGTGVEPAVYEKLIFRWLKLIHAGIDWKSLEEPMGAMTSLRRVIVALPPEAGQRIVEECQRMFGSAPIKLLLGFERPEDVALIKGVLRRIDRTRDKSVEIPHALAKSVDNPKADPAYLLAVASIWPELAPWIGSGMQYMFYFRRLSARIPESAAREALVATIRAVIATKDGQAIQMPQLLFPAWGTWTSRPGPDHVFVTRVLIPVFPKMLEEMPPPIRASVISNALGYSADLRTPAEDRAGLAPAILESIRGLGRFRVGISWWKFMMPYPEDYPLDQWAHHLTQYEWMRMVRKNKGPSAEAVVRASRTYVENPSRINDSVAYMLKKYLPDERLVEVAEELYRKGDTALLSTLVALHYPGPSDLLEKRTLELAGDPKASEWKIALFARRLVASRPSPRLFPVVKRLMRSEDPSIVMGAMDLATLLGSEELIASMAPALDSLNAQLRQKAKKSIESILDNRRIKKELDSRRIKKEIADRLGEK